MEPQNPIHKDLDGKWYFWDETWADRYGPYNTEEEANEALERYGDYLDGRYENGPENT